jgi:hypothetical protein
LAVSSLEAQTYTVTNAGATGRTGPTQTQVNSTYASGNTLHGAVTINTQGIQEWTVPATGTYTIEVWGAEGGDGASQYAPGDGGKGARMKGDFSLVKDEKLLIVVGQSGQSGAAAPTAYYGGGGGGGTFIAKGSSYESASPLIIAGGGGGGGYNNTNANAWVNESGRDGTKQNSGTPGTGGVNGNGATGNIIYGGPGAGFYSDGSGNYNYNGEKGLGFRTSAAIGGDGRYGGMGGFGGGGGGYGGAGGGGGYSGGGGGAWSYGGAGGGGGSHNAGANQDNAVGVREGHGQVVITTVTSVSTVSSVSSTTANGTYKMGDVIAVTVTFSEAVTVTGTPKLTLETGSTDAVVNYSSGSGSTTLTFNYTVASGHISSDLDYANTTALALNSGTIKDAEGNNAILTFASPGGSNSLGANKVLVIDTTAPTAPSVTGSTPTNDTTPTWSWSSGGGGNGTYRYKLNSGSWSTTTGTSYTPSALGEGTQTLYVQERDTAGNWSSSGSRSVVIDTTAPRVSETVVLYETTTPTRVNNNIVYSLDNSSSFSNSDLQANGARIGYRMELTYNSTDYYAETVFDAWEGVTLNSLLFPTDSNANVIQRTVSNMRVNSNYPTVTNTSSTSGRLEIWPYNYGREAQNNIGGNNNTYDFDDKHSGSSSYGSMQVHNLSAGQTVMAWNNHGASNPDIGLGNSPSGDPDWTFEGSGSLGTSNWRFQVLFGDPTSIAISSATGVQNSLLNTGDVVSVTATFSENVTVSGTPKLTLNVGGTNRAATYTSGSASTALVFEYTIQAGETDADGISIGANALVLNSGTIRDIVGNNATLTHGAVSANANYKVDTTAPSVPSVTGGTPTNDTTPTWSWSSGGGGGNGTYRYKLNSGSWSTTTGTSYTPSALGEGTQTLYVQERDTAGNWSSSGSRSVVIDTTAPTITISSLTHALDFDGTDDYVTTPIDADLQAMLSTTWSGWIKPNGSSTGWQIIFGMEDGGWDRMIAVEANSLGLSMGHTDNRWQTGASITAGVWQHVVSIYDNGAMRFYLNGVEYTTSNLEGSHSSTGTFTIGANQGGGNYYSGLIDDVAIWDEALTAAEITTIYNSGTQLDVSSDSGNYSSSANLVGYWRFDSGSGTTAVDASGNSQDATITGATWGTSQAALASGSTSSDSTLPITFTLSETAANFADTDITVTNGTLSDFTGSGTSYTATLTPTGGGVVTIDVASSAFTDAVGNNNTGATQYTWTYDAPNTAPVAVAQSVTTNEDTTVTVTLVGTDADSGDQLTFTVVTQPANGALSGTAPALTYTPSANYNGTDSFMFKANDTTLDSNTATVSITINPVNDAPSGSVTISGTTTEDQVLTASNNLADEDGLGSISYQWKRAGDAIPGASASTYILTQADVGKAITVTANYTDGQSRSESVTSSATGAVANVNDTPSGTVMISGTATEGEVLTAGNNLVDEDGLGLFSYQWKRSGSNINGAIASTYTLGQVDVGHAITVTASYMDGQSSSESVTSVATDAVANVNDAPSGSVIISGTVTEGQMLTAVTGTIADEDGLGSFGYQWNRAGSAINGATSSSYELVQADVDKVITVAVSYTDAQGTAESVTSTATAVVANVNDLPVVASALPDITSTEDGPDLEIGFAPVFHDNDPLDDAAMSYAVTENSNETLVSSSVSGEVLTLDFQDQQYGTAEITVTATSGVNTVSDTFIVTIANVNDLPVVASVLSDITPTEDDPDLDIDLAPVFHDNDPVDDDAMSYAVSANSNTTLVGSSVTGGTLTLDFQDQQYGTATLTVTASSGVDTVSDTFIVTIDNVNDLPVVVSALPDITPLEDDPDMAIDLGPVFHDADPDDDAAMSYAVSANSNTTLVSTSVTGGTLTLDFQDQEYGTATLTVTASFGVNTISDTFIVMITNVNDAPVATDQTDKVKTDVTKNINLNVYDNDGDDVEVKVAIFPLKGRIGGVIYNSRHSTYEAYFKTGTEFGDEIDLGTGGRRLSEFAFEAYAELINKPSGSSPTATLMIYANDGSIYGGVNAGKEGGAGYSAAMPGTLLYMSDAKALVEGFHTYWVTDINVDLPAKVTWTVEFSGVDGNELSTGNRAGLILAGTDVVGNSLDDFWQKDATGWKLYRTGSSAQPDDFTANVIAYDKDSLVIKYTPASGASGADSFVYEVIDGNGGGDTATVTIEINNAPVAVDDSVTISEDTVLTLVVLANDSDMDGDTLSVDSTSSPSHGSVTLNNDGTLVYTPGANFNGSDSFSYTLSDGNGGSDAGSVTVTVAAVNDPGVISGDTSGAGDEDTTLSGALSGTDPDGLTDGTYFAVSVDPAHGSAAIDAATGTWGYAPQADFNGTDSFTVTLTDDAGEITSQFISVTVAAVNDVPLFTSTAPVGATQDTAYGYSVTASDVDAGDSLTITAPTKPAWLSLTDNGDGTATLSGTPSNAEVGNHSVVLRVSDSGGAFNEQAFAVVVANVNDAPVLAITGTATEDQTLTTVVNDEDGLGTISYQWKRAGAAISGATVSTYMLTQADVGKAITVTASYTDALGTDESVTSSATAAVANVNDAPVLAITGTATEDQTLTTVVNDEDGLGTISYQWKRAGAAISGATANSYTLGQADVGKAITVAVSYTDALGTAESVTSSATAAVANVNDTPSGSVTISGTTTEDQVLTVSNNLADEDGFGTISYQWKRAGAAISGATSTSYTLIQADVGKAITVTARYTDAQGTAESVSSVATAGVANVNDTPSGTVTISGTATEGQVLTAGNDMVDEDGLGSFGYQWKRGGVDISGATSSSYTLGQADVGKAITVTASYTDALGTDESVTSAATAAVANVNDTPSGTVTISGTATEDQVLTAGNDLGDEDGLGSFGYQWKRDGVEISGGPINSYTLGQADVGKAITLVVSYTDAQGTAESVSSVATAAVANVNDAPTVSDLIRSGNEDSTITITLSGIDEDPGDILTSSVVSLPSHGSVSLSGTTATYTPHINFNGSDSFMFKVNDGSADSNSASVNITVNPVNDAPVADDQSKITDEDTAVTIALTASDVDADLLIYHIVDMPVNGSLSGVGASFQYAPASGFSGSDFFTFKVFDSHTESGVATVNITINDTSVTQSISLKQGWNLVSLHTQPADMSPSSIFSGHFDVIGEVRTLQGVFNSSWPTFLNTIQQLDLASGYWVKANIASSDIQVSGIPPTSTDINLIKGWNLIGFPSVSAQDTATLFKPLSDKSVIDRVIGTGDFYTFDSNALINSLSSLKPGDGYWVKMLEADTLTVTSVEADNGQNGGRNLGKAGGKTKFAELKQQLVAYPSVPAICVTEVRAGGRQAPTGSLLAAYVGDELRGVQEVRFQDGKMIVPGVIQSSQPAEVRFRLWHAGLAKWFEITERVQVDSGDALGMGDAGQVVLNVTLPWPSTPELVLKQNPLGLAVRHESARRFIVEQSPDLNNWEQRWQLTATGQWQEIKIPAANAQKYFRVRTLE